MSAPKRGERKENEKKNNGEWLGRLGKPCFLALRGMELLLCPPPTRRLWWH